MLLQPCMHEKRKINSNTIKNNSSLSVHYVLYFKKFFLLRKIHPELTSVANLPLFLLEEDYPWANICANLPPLCMWDAATAWLMSRVSPHPGSTLVNPGCQSRTRGTLTTQPWGQPQELAFLYGTSILFGWLSVYLNSSSTLSYLK